MNRTIKIIIGIICIIILFGVACFATFKLTNKSNPEENTINENTINQTNTNVTNSLDENTVDLENTVRNETADNTTTEPTKTPTPVPTTVTTTVTPPNQIYENNSDITTTDKQEQAINLVKAQWGEDSTVTFNCDHVTEKGEYVIAVVSTETASVKSYFIVNLESKTVTVDY